MFLRRRHARTPRACGSRRPQAIFVGFGDSSINFELRAWTDDFANEVRIRTDLAAAVYDSVNEAGMAFPFPQREVRLLSDSKDAFPLASADTVTARYEGNSRAERESKRPENEPGRE
jgi:small-conductance mechanosensitive channel